MPQAPLEPSSRLILQHKREEHEAIQDTAELALYGGLACLSRTPELSAKSLPLWAEFLGGAFIAGVSLIETTRLAYHNKDWIAALDTRVTAFLRHADLQTLQKDTNVVTRTDIEKACLGALKKEITKDVLYAGFLQSLSLAGLVFSVGQLSPPTFAITALLSLGIFTAGGFVTAVMAYKFRKQVEKNCQEFFQNKENDALFEETLERLKTIKETYKKRTLFETILHRIKQALSPLFFIMQIMRIAEDFFTAFKVIAPVMSLATSMLSAIVNPVTNYWARQRYLLPENKDLFKQKIVFENIFSKKYIFFGKSKLDLFREEAKKLNVSFDSDAEEHRVCQDYYKKKDFFEFASKQNKSISQKDFEKHKIRSFVKKDVWTSGMINTFYVSSFFIGLGMFFPPLLIPSLAIAAIAAVAGVITTAIVAHKEANKFEEAFSDDVKVSSIEQTPTPNSDTKRFSDASKTIPLNISTLENTLVDRDKKHPL